MKKGCDALSDPIFMLVRKLPEKEDQSQQNIVLTVCVYSISRAIKMDAFEAMSPLTTSYSCCQKDSQA
jgi:hypothetical protein